MLILKLVLAFIALATSPSKPEKIIPLKRGLGICTVTSTPTAVETNGYLVTRFGPINLVASCVADKPGETFTFRWSYNGVLTTGFSRTINPPAPGMHTVDVEVDACWPNPDDGNKIVCDRSGGWVDFYVARPAPISAAVTGPQCRKSEFGWYETDIEVTAPDPDGDNPSTVEVMPEVLASSPEFTALSKISDLPNGKSLYRLIHQRPGVAKFYFQSYNNDFPWYLLRKTPVMSVQCDAEYSVTLNRIYLSQSPLMLGSPTVNNITLIQKKPMVARLDLKINKPVASEDLERKVSASVTLKADSSAQVSHSLVGCVKLGDFDESNSQTIELYPGAYSSTFLQEGTGKINVEINSVDNVAGIHPGKGCGDQPTNTILHATYVTAKTYEDRALYSAFESPQISLAFWKVTPPCFFNFFCEFNPQDDIQAFAQNSSNLLKAMYPIAPASVEVESKEEWTIGSRGFWGAQLGKLREVCEFSGFRDHKCFHYWAQEIDILRVKAAGLKADKGKTFANRRYIAVVPKSGIFGKSYYEALHQRFPEAKNAAIKGLTVFFENTPAAFMAQSDFPLGTPHEMVHSLGASYSTPGDRNHQPQSAKATGYDLSGLNGVLKFQVASLMRPYLENNPSLAWIDGNTYFQVFEKLKAGSRTAKIDGDELFITGVINREGKFVASGMYSGLKAGLSVSDSPGQLQVYTYTAAGAVISQSNISYDHRLIPESDSEHLEEYDGLASISTGIPYSSNTFRMSISPIGTNKASVRTFFPIIEVVRSGVDEIPNSGFEGNSNESRQSLYETLEKVENELHQSNIDSAIRIFKNEFQSKAITLVKEDFERRSPLDVGREELLDLISESNDRLELISNETPSFQNDFLQARVPSSINGGQRADILVNARRLPANPDFEYHLYASSEGSGQKVIEISRGRQWKIQTAPLEAGSHHILVNLFMQDAKVARSIELSIDKYKYELVILTKQLEETFDPQQKMEILKKIEKIRAGILELEHKLQQGRKQISVPLVVPLEVS